jgi:Histidine kinase
MANSQSAVGRHRALLIAACWLAVVFLFATQWFVYGAARGYADPFRYYLWWSCYTWGILTPAVAKLAYHNPISAASWKRALPLHLGASCVLIAGEISIEALFGKLRLHHNLSIEEALRHYFTRHTQVSVLTYWMLVGAVQLYQMRDEARKRELRSAKLEAQLTTAQLEVLRAQIHPHFLFNTLQAATMLIHEDPDGAEDILLRLSELLRVSVDEGHIQEISLKRELEILDLYMQSRVEDDRHVNGSPSSNSTPAFDRSFGKLVLEVCDAVVTEVGRNRYTGRANDGNSIFTQAAKDALRSNWNDRRVIYFHPLKIRRASAFGVRPPSRHQPLSPYRETVYCFWPNVIKTLKQLTIEVMKSS